MGTVLNFPDNDITFTDFGTPKYKGDPMPECKPAKVEPITAEEARRFAETVRTEKRKTVLKKALSDCYKMIREAIDKGDMSTWWPINCPREYPLPYTNEEELTIQKYQEFFEGVRYALQGQGYDVKYEVKYDEDILTGVMNIAW